MENMENMDNSNNVEQFISVIYNQYKSIAYLI